MERNVCGVDRIVRLTVGTALALLTATSLRERGEQRRSQPIAPWHVVAAYAAAELLLTGLMQWCPGNYLFGINTCEQNTRSALRDVRRRMSPLSEA